MVCYHAVLLRLLFLGAGHAADTLLIFDVFGVLAVAVLVLLRVMQCSAAFSVL
jgi:hypothetical protein